MRTRTVGERLRFASKTKKKYCFHSTSFVLLSDRRGSNPRSRPWQGRALPTTPLSHIWCAFLKHKTYNNGQTLFCQLFSLKFTTKFLTNLFISKYYPFTIHVPGNFSVTFHPFQFVTGTFFI